MTTTGNDAVPSNSIDRTALYQELVSQLTIAEKVALLTGSDTFIMAGEQKIGLGKVALSDGPTGVRGLKFSGGRQVALLPNATLLASAWSEQTAFEVGKLLSEEAIAQQISVVLGPTINLHRSLLGGRLFEAYSEDPLLTGKLAAAYVRGLQSNQIGACLKHLVGNESETARHTMNSVIDEATLRELYLLPFEIAVEESDPWSIMSAYNQLNGITSTAQQHVQNDIVKDEWRWSGLIMSDWYATKSIDAAAGGLDLVMPGPRGPWGDKLITAVEAGQVVESAIDDHVVRVLRLADRVGQLGGSRSWPPEPAPDSPQRKDQLKRLAAAGITVLTNNERVLPLDRQLSVALIGRHAVETIDMGGGSARVNPPYQTSVAEGLAAVLTGSLSVTDGVEVRSRAVSARPGFIVDPEDDTPGVRAHLYSVDDAQVTERHYDRAQLLLGFDDDFGQPIDRVVLVGRTPIGGELEVGGLGSGNWIVRSSSDSFEFSVRAPEGNFGEAMLAPPSHSRIISLPAGGLIEAEWRRTPSAGGGLNAVAIVGLIARPAPRDSDAVIAEAVAAAVASDVAIVVVGFTEEQETESIDKTTLQLPGRQNDLVEEVAAAAKRTIVVVNAATPAIMPWLGSVDAVLWAGLPGQEGGHAIAAALLGSIEPAGRLVTTFPVDDALTPAWSVTPVDGDLPYTEGTFIGYRGHFAGNAPEPAFWFGHGLGYGSWNMPTRDSVPQRMRAISRSRSPFATPVTGLVGRLFSYISSRTNLINRCGSSVGLPQHSRLVSPPR